MNSPKIKPSWLQHHTTPLFGGGPSRGVELVGCGLPFLDEETIHVFRVFDVGGNSGASDGSALSTLDAVQLLLQDGNVSLQKLQFCVAANFCHGCFYQLFVVFVVFGVVAVVKSRVLYSIQRRLFNRKRCAL